MTNCNLFAEIIAEIKRMNEENEKIKIEMKSLIDENLTLRERIISIEENLNSQFLKFVQENDLATQEMMKEIAISEIADYDFTRHQDFRSFEDKIEEVESQLSDIQDSMGDLDADEISDKVIKEIKSRL
jgi:hypothetical protein